ncbi:ABC transporter ATP-binding protein [Leadbettera azotonutricia]|uniref:Abc transporter, hydrophobic amino acid uptake transporter (Haat) family, ATP-binding protein n=1 Tax=Leadbettera azotonutricia (strain ATCC BAA-888 / DSM 13862 / ZAS-9) TaxID=545695 RepID=F5YFY1_LEAAZ|nr:ABC transporter ATP-binding protein [Leadbettera azotonutricia]AEF83264.1 abc transporter, hydrophobic amino acid uptake transporter (haat) family, ATP-binding protein [Leadbettera azotonutricia ZAS-9]
MLLEVKDLKVSYGNIEVLHGISFNIDKGEIVTLIGANGAGKTSTLASLARLPRPEAPVVTGGDILYEGLSMLKTEPHTLVQRHMMALVPEGRHIFGNLTVEENLKIATYPNRKEVNKAVINAETVEMVYSLFPRLEERRKQRGELLSGGEQQMLAVGRALMTGSNFIMLDEPSMGLAPKLMYEMFRALRQLNQIKHITILVVEQNAKVALEFASRGYVLKTGEIIVQGSSDELAANPDVKKAYLGG